MTYLQFHLIFIVPPLLLLAPALPRAVARFGGRAAWTIPAVAVIALVYTTPWDNYLVYSGIWWYGADRVLATIGWVPVEEYLFFVLQPVLTGAWAYRLLLRRSGDGVRTALQAHPVPLQRSDVDGLATAVDGLGSARNLGAGVYALLAAAGALALTYPSGRYLGLVLAWAAPVLAAQWFFVGGTLARAPRFFAAAVLVPTIYLWIADRVAIGAGIWTISATATTGVHLFGLPVEEAVFFLVTNLLIVQGVLLFLGPALVRGAPAPAAAGTTAALRRDRQRPASHRMPVRTNGAQR